MQAHLSLYRGPRTDWYECRIVLMCVCIILRVRRFLQYKVVQSPVFLGMLSWENVGVIAITFVGTMICHLVSPHIYKRTCKTAYCTLPLRERCKIDRYLGTAITVLLCFAFALKAFAFEPDFHQLTLLGFSASGNAALGIMIGQCLSDFLYEWMVTGTFGSYRNVGHHLAAIFGAGVGFKVGHRLVVYRFIHHISLPSVIIYDVMRKWKCNTRSYLFRSVMSINLFIFFLFRVVVIPFHWVWYFYEIFTWRDEWQKIWLPFWIVFVGGIVIDYVNVKWAIGLLKIYRETVDSNKERDE